MTNMLASLITAIHLAALSQIESGDNDRAIGKQGEVTRYQIAPEVWRQILYTQHRMGTSPRDEKQARAVAKAIWSCRVSVFQMDHHRQPTLPELYLLWHRPARVLNPKPRERERAERFENLVNQLQRESK
jgi:hypothetical protein